MTHFHTYLYGHDVTVYTDNAAVRAVLETPNPSGKHARWWSKVYSSGIKTIKVIHKSGKTNKNANALSRNPVEPLECRANGDSQVAAVRSDGADLTELLQLEPEINPVRNVTDFALEQRKDPLIREIVMFLESNKLPLDKDRAKRLALRSTLFVLIDGIVYYVDGKQGGRKRAVVPSHLQHQ